MDYSRNIKNYHFQAIINTEKREKIKNQVQLTISHIKGEDGFNMKPIKFPEHEDDGRNLIDLFGMNYSEIERTLLKLGVKNQWPENREIYINNDTTQMILVNFLDHVRFVIKDESSLSKAYQKLVNLHNNFEKISKFEYHKVYGFLNSSPTLLGAGLEIYCEIIIDKLCKHNEINQIIENLDMHVHDYTEKSEVLRVSSRHSLRQTEDEFIEDFYDQVRSLILLNSNFDMYNSEREIFFPDNEHPLAKTYQNQHDFYMYKVSPFGTTINSLMQPFKENPNSELEWIIFNKREYAFYRKFVTAYIQEQQDFDAKADKLTHSSELSYLGSNEAMDRIIRGRITMIRNLNDYPFLASGQADAHSLEKLIVEALKSLKFLSGDYTKNIADFEKDEYNGLNKSKDLSSYPALKTIERGVFRFDDNFIAIVNDVDHIKFNITFEREIVDAYRTITDVVNDFETSLKFSYDRNFGFLTSSPKYLGTGTVVKLELKTNAIAADEIEGKAEKFRCNFGYNSDNLIVFNKSTIGTTSQRILENIMNFIIEVHKLNQ